MSATFETDIGSEDSGAVPKQSLPPRVAKRPNPSQWSEHELLSLVEAAALFWPDGPLSLASLRTAVDAGQLHVAVVARKFLTTKASIEKMSICSPRTVLHPPAVSDDAKLKIYEQIDALRGKSR